MCLHEMHYETSCVNMVYSHYGSKETESGIILIVMNIKNKHLYPSHKGRL